MVEAASVLAMVRLGEPYPSPEELGVGMVSYLNGMGEAASEARRYVLDEMRKGRRARPNAFLARWRRSTTT